MNRKILLGLIILVLTAVIIGTVVFYLQQKNEYVEWNIPAETTKSIDLTALKQAVLENPKISGDEVKRYGKETNSFLSIDNIKQEGDWVSISATSRSKVDDSVIPTEGIGYMGKKIDGKWKVVGVGEKEFIQWLPDVPESLISKESKAYFYTLFGSPSE